MYKFYFKYMLILIIINYLVSNGFELFRTLRIKNKRHEESFEVLT